MNHAMPNIVTYDQVGCTSEPPIFEVPNQFLKALTKSKVRADALYILNEYGEDS